MMSREDDLKRLFGALFGARRKRSFRDYHDFSFYPEDASPEAFEDADFSPRPPDVNDEDGNPLNLLQVFETVQWIQTVSLWDGVLKEIVKDSEQARKIAESLQDEVEEVQATSLLIPVWLAEEALSDISNLGEGGYEQFSKLLSHAVRKKEVYSWSAYMQDFKDLSSTHQKERRQQFIEYHLDWDHVAKGTRVYTSTDDAGLQVFFSDWSDGDGSIPMVVATDRSLVEAFKSVVETGYPRTERRMLTFMVKRDLIRVQPEGTWVESFKDSFNIHPPDDDGEHIAKVYREDIKVNHPGHPATHLRGKTPEVFGLGPWLTMLETSGETLQLIAVDSLP